MPPARRYLLAAAWFILWPPLTAAQQVGLRDIELVESIPVGTTLDNADIRNTREVWLEMINGARSTLDIEQFYVSTKAGESLDAVITAITGAAHRGVHVRFIVDGRMHRTYPGTVDSLGTLHNIAVRVIDYGKIAGGIQHAKFFIVDGQSVFLGSQNFDWRALSHIHELGLRIHHVPTAGAFGRIFEIDWTLAGFAGTDSTRDGLTSEPITAPFPIPLGPGDTVLLSPTWSPRPLIPDTLLWDEPQMVRLIDAAEHEVVLQFLSYSPVGRNGSPYTVIDDALRRAAKRGVSVKMIVADWEKATPGERHLRDLSSVKNIEVRYSVIPGWSGGYVAFARVEHCKYIVADGNRFWLGTSNCEKSYFYTSRNVGVVCENATLAGRLQRIFSKSWDGPYLEPIAPEGVYTPREHGGE